MERFRSHEVVETWMNNPKNSDFIMMDDAQQEVFDFYRVFVLEKDPERVTPDQLEQIASTRDQVGKLFCNNMQYN